MIVSLRTTGTRFTGQSISPAPGGGARMMVEALEARQLLSASATVVGPGAALHRSVTPGVEQPLLNELTAAATAAAKQGHATTLPLQITDVLLQDGQLVLQGLLGNTPFTAPITLSSSPNAANPDCPILDLHLGPIHLDVLGLVVDTSKICLDITAQHGQGCWATYCATSPTCWIKGRRSEAS